MTAPTAVSTSHGRTLQLHTAGDPGGEMVLVHHGTPDSGGLYAPWIADAEARGIHLVGYDRPGYGGSTRFPGRNAADVAVDAGAIADALGHARFATWGVSGGGPHALACAALLGDRVTRCASLAGVAPFDAEGLNWFRGMGEENWSEVGAALWGRDAVAELVREQVAEILALSADELVAYMGGLISGVDQEAFAGAFGEGWAAALVDAFAQGGEGWIEDDMVFVRPWGFELTDITVPVLVWHGSNDQFVPQAHGRWLAEQIPTAQARFTDDGHLTLEAHRIPEVHAWLLDGA